MAVKKEIKNGIKFVYLRGRTPYEIGFQHGEILKDEISLLIKDFLEYSRKRYGLIPTQFFNHLLIIYSMLIKRTISDEILEEMKGISDASGQPLKWLLFTYIIYEIGIRFQGFLSGCSAFMTMLSGSNTILFAKTTDFSSPEGLSNVLAKHKTMFVYDCKWLEHKFLIPSFPLCLVGDSIIFDNGVIIGFNDGGKFIKSTNFKNERIVKIQRDLTKGEITSDSIKEKLLKSKPIKPFTALISDGSKNGSYLLDLSPKEKYVKNLEENLINTNFLATEEMRTKIYKDNYMQDIHTKASFIRYDNIKDCIDDEVIDINEVEKILAIHTKDNDIDKGSIANMGTVHAFICVPEQKKLFIANGNKPPVNLNSEWVIFSFEELFQ